MSYILEALRRADSERERGGVPGIHARPLPAELSEAPDGGWFTRPLAWVCAALALVLVGALGWQALKDEPPAAATSATPPPVPAATMNVAPVPAPSAAMSSAPAPVIAPVTAPPAAATTADDRPAAEAARPEPVVVPPAARELLAAEEAASRQRAAKAATPAASQAAASARAPATRAPAPTPAAASAAPPAEAPILALRELPEDVRRSLPALAIGGSVYSANPAGRFVVINGQIVHEGDKLGPELMLEQIRLKSAVLRYKTHRFEIDY